MSWQEELNKKLEAQRAAYKESIESGEVDRRIKSHRGKIRGILSKDSGQGMHSDNIEIRQEIAKKGNDTLGSEGRKARMAKANNTLGEEGRKERSKKCNDTLGPEGRTARSLKTAVHLKNMALERYREILTLLPDTFYVKDLNLVLESFNYSGKVGRRLLRSELVIKLPHTGLVTKSNPYIYKKVIN